MAQNIIKVTEKTEYEVLAAPAKALASGGLVAFPTETVYGLGANALDEKAVSLIFAAKGRPQDNPLIVHVAEKQDIAPLVAEIPPAAEKIFSALSPGPITVILKKSSLVPDVVTAGGETVAVRIPGHALARKLIKAAGVPVAAPSANLSGRPSPTTAAHVAEDLGDAVAYIIDGGSCTVGLESTVIDVTVTPPRILRPGGVSQEALSALLGRVEGYAPKDTDENAPKSPGMKYTHYAPKTPMTVFEGKACRAAIHNALAQHPEKKVYILTAGHADYEGATAFNCGETPEQYAQLLFFALRRADEAAPDMIFAELPFSSGGIITALKNRIYKSCGGNVVSCK